MGEVYRAKDTRLDRIVAIKVLPSHVADLPEARQRLDREAKAISNLSHPHICALYDVGHQDGVDFLVMEYLEGETLLARIERGPLPPVELLRYGIQSRTPSIAPTARGSFTAISSPATSCSRNPAPSSSTSASRRASPRPAPSPD